MINLENDIINTINNYNDFSFLGVKAKKPYSYQPSDLTKPLVIVQKIYSKSNDRTFTEKEEYEDFSYQITLLSRNQKDQNKETVHGYEVVDTLGNEIVQLLYDKYLLRRQGGFAIYPMRDDNTVMMCVFRVNGTIDLTHEYLYTR